MKLKLCRRCNTKKPTSEFAKRGRGAQPWCDSCKQKYNQDYYEHTRDAQIKSKKERRAELRARMRALKATLRCARCPENHPSCLEFHHRDPQTKDFSIGLAIGKLWSWERIENEIAKCDVLCSNCHRKHHYQEEEHLESGS